MVRVDKTVLHGSPFKQLINQTLMRKKRRELTVSLLMQDSLNRARRTIVAASKRSSTQDEHQQ